MKPHKPSLPAAKTKAKAKSSSQAVILINLGTPENTTLSAVRKYLFEFLMDPYVIDIPYISRLGLVGGIIAPIRSFSSRKAYQAIWGEKGSPLLVLSEELRTKLSRYVKAPIYLAMRYGKPSITTVVKNALHHLNYKGSLHIIPLYPQHAMSTTLTIYQQLTHTLHSLIPSHPSLLHDVNLTIEAPFYKKPSYLHALAMSIKPYVKDLGKKNGYDYILFSYHGVPIRHLTKIDTANHCCTTVDCCTRSASASHAICYRHQVMHTTLAIEKRLNLPAKRIGISFQSRLGSNWLTPYTDQVVKTLAKKGVKKLLVVTPAFVTDNLETLFEIAEENAEFFQAAGGEKLTLIPCLNTHPLWLASLQEMIAKPTDFTPALVQANAEFQLTSPS